ncbi:MAG: discoidin domain-containing protein, partial [Bifidobacteriaceae bacterium]|nr:discoidin domain-containing protein [Bifidobacteriaceae bacterium]
MHKMKSRQLGKPLALLAAVAVAVPVGVGAVVSPAAAVDTNIAFHRSVIADNWTRTQASFQPWWADQPQADAVITETDLTPQLITDGVFDPSGTPDWPTYQTGFTGNAQPSTPLDYPFGPDVAFDGRKDSYWQITKTTADAGDPYLQINLPQPAAIAKYALTNTGSVRNLSSETERDYREPKAWTLQGSNDGTTWSNLDQQDFTTAPSPFDPRVLNSTGLSVVDTPDAVYTARRQTREFTAASNPGSYTSYRLVITDWDKTTLDVNRPSQATNDKDPQDNGAVNDSLFGAALDPETVRLALLDLVDAAGKSVVPDPLQSEWVAPAGDASATVDLGADSTISAANIVWDNSGALDGKVTVRVANDPKPDWSTVTPVVADVDATSGVQALFTGESASGRYVHLELKGGTSEYKIQEFEVYGTNSLTYTLPAQPAPAADGSVELTGGKWELVRSSFETQSGQDLSTVGAAWSKPEFAVPALVPGTVLQSYIAAGIIPDTNFADNQLQVSDRYFLSDFWYRNEFQIDAAQLGRKVWRS